MLWNIRWRPLQFVDIEDPGSANSDDRGYLCDDILNVRPMNLPMNHRIIEMVQQDAL